MTWFTLIITVLAAYRLTRFVARDEIPFGPLRRRLVARWADTIFDEGLTCFWCLGAWISGALIAGLDLSGISVPLPGLVALAISTVIGLLGGVDDRLS